MKFIKYPSIGKLADIKHNLSQALLSYGVNPRELVLPTIEFTITEKHHGTNMCVAYNNIDNLSVQSRTRFITPEQDNAGSARFVYDRISSFTTTIEQLARQHDINLDKQSIYLYAEFNGGNIQGKSSLSGCEKHCILFEYFAVADIESDEIDRWYPTNNIDCQKDRILNVSNLYKHDYIIDLNKYKEELELLENLVIEIEDCSPTGKLFNKNNTGEGIVGSIYFDGQLKQFKLKGNKHTKSSKRPKDPSKAMSNPELKQAAELAYKVCPAWRLEQMFDENTPNARDMKQMGAFLKLVSQDIKKEEQSIFAEANLTLRDIGKFTNEIAREYFKQRIQDQE